MNDLLKRLEKLSPRKLVLLAADLQARLEAATAANHGYEPIALIGAGCRFPGGVESPDAYWRLLTEGRDAVTEVPEQRWDVDHYYDPDPDKPGKMSTRRGGFIEGIDLFDAAFFGISPREAAGMDPQQRLLLEVCWHALENAGQSPEKLSGTQTGVFVGMSTHDYHELLLRRGSGAIDAYLATGSAHSIAAGRVAYCLGLQGPNIAVDTACSSSLAAVHLACQSLRSRECRIALAGGVNAILSPQTTITLSKAHMMAPDGKCKAFDEAADGFVRAEGCGIVVLKRLSDAIADRDSILAVIRGSAINQDGRSSGITAPNGAAQERVLRQALENAGLASNNVGYIETHGTGTSLGDPIEAHALQAVFGSTRGTAPALKIGSVKTNLGHLESAAGIAGLIKAALCVNKGFIPQQLHFNKLNPHIMWNRDAIEVAAAPAPWQPDGPRIAGVSSFGFSGTNVHILLEQPPAFEEAPAEEGVHVLPLSAKSEEALEEIIRSYRILLESNPEASLADLCRTAAAGRSHFGWRKAFTASTRSELSVELSGTRAAREPADGPRDPVFFFPALGRGSDAGTAIRHEELYARYAIFRKTWDQCTALLGASAGRFGAAFTAQCSLSDLWKSWGVRPAGILGQIEAQPAALYAAGILSLADACVLLADLEQKADGAASRLAWQQPSIPFISPATGAPLNPRGLGDLAATPAGSPSSARERAAASGFTLLLDIAVPEADSQRALLNRAASLYLEGGSIDWAAVEGTGRAIPSVTYPFARRSYWLEPAAQRPPAPAAESSAWHTAGARLATAVPTFEVRLDQDQFKFLNQHRVNETAIVPCSFFLEMAFAVSAELFRELKDVCDLVIHSPLRLDDARATRLQLVVNDPAAGRFGIYGSGPAGDWHLHVTGTFAAAAGELPGPEPAEPTDGDGPDAFYALLEECGIALGEEFRSIRSLTAGALESSARIALPASLSAFGYLLHPVLIDGALQAFGAIFASSPEGRSGTPALLSGIGRVRLGRTGETALLVRASGTAGGGGSFTGNAVVTDSHGAAVLHFEDIRVRPLAGAAAPRPHDLERNYFWKLDWKEMPRAASVAAPIQPLPDPAAVEAGLKARTSALAVSTGFDRYGEFSEDSDKICAALIASALEYAGASLRPGATIPDRSLPEALGIPKRYERLTRRLLDILREDGTIERREDDWIVLKTPQTSMPREAVRHAGLFSAELELTLRCGARLGSILRGETDPLSVLFPAGAVETTDNLYTHSPSAVVFNSVLREALENAAAAYPARKDWRILEIGAGTGGSTAYALPVFDGRASEYVFTDLSPSFLSRAQRRFAGHAHLGTELLDIEKDPAGQGFSARFDFVIAANVLHATSDLARSLRHAASLVRPGGWIVLLEGTRPERWVDVTFGLTEGWWRFEDSGLRPEYPLIGEAEWKRVLHETGFETPTAIRAGDSQQVLLLARKPAAAAGDAWALLADRGGIAQAASEELRRRGHRCFLLAGGEELAEVDVPLAGIVDLRPVDCPGGILPSDEMREAQRVLSSRFFDVLRSAKTRGSGTRFWTVTRGGVVTEGQRAVSPAQSLLWGLARAAGLELPDAWGGIVDVDPEASALDAAALVDEWTAPDSDSEIALRSGSRLAPRLCPAVPSPPQALTIRADRAYLVTGGLGALGLKAARRLVERGARRIYLLGRTRRRLESAAELEGMGARVEIVTADIADADAMREVLARFGASEPALAGVIHAAAHFDSTAVDAMTPSAFDAVLAPKVAGSLLLHELTASQPLDFMLFFSSTTGLIGAKGLGHYAAANQFLDALAHARRLEGRTCTSVDWGIWDDMSAASEESREHTLQSGLVPMDSRAALDAMVRMLASSEAQIAVARADWDLLRSRYEARRTRPVFDEVAPRRSAKPSGSSAAQPTDALLEYRRLPASQRPDFVTRRITGEASAILGMKPEELHRSMGLFDLGMDSLMSVDLRSRLEKVFGLPLPATLTFNYPTVAALGKFIHGEIAKSEGPEPAPSRPASPKDAGAIPAGTTVTNAQPAPADLRDDEDDLSEDELAGLLEASLKSIH